MKIRSLDGKTPDIAEENIQKLRQIFPDVFTEDKIDFEKLQQVLGEYVEDSKERYNFTWNGKGQALRLSQTPSLGTLRPCKKESKDWDKTQNLYIEGDNLEVLKLLQKSYYGKVKMIYIDPPYNTGKDFVYKDDFHDSLENYKRITGQVDKDGNRLSTNAEASGRYHTDWLNMMYPRLRLARNLLAEDGVVFISIDDNEVDNLKKICNEVFGEDNFIGCAGRITKKSNNKGDFWAPNFDYLLTYTKNIVCAEPFFGGAKYA
ncbi:TPA: site-specific DNA-methyltransferase [Streptococcus suis]